MNLHTGFVLLLLLFAASSSAQQELVLTATVSPSTVVHGEDVAVSGICTGHTVLISGRQGALNLFDTSTPCTDSTYSYTLPVSFLYPAGTIELELSNNGADAGVAEFEIEPSRESGFYAIVFLSPAGVDVERASAIDLRVQITDAGQAAHDLSVQTWDFTGQPVALVQIEDGVYGTRLDVPFDLPLGSHSLEVTAENADQTAGGNQRLELPIQPARIQLSLTSPILTSIQALENTQFEALARYANEKPLESPVVTIQINSQEYDLSKATPTIFRFSKRFSEEEIGKHAVTLRAVDSAGNEVRQTYEIFVSGSPLVGATNLAPYLLVALVILAVGRFIFIPQIRTKKTQTQLSERSKEIEREITELQTQYFEQNSISKETFEQKSLALEKELAEINKKIILPKK